MDAYKAHSQPNGRPVHPACTFQKGARFGEGQPCSCDKLWGGWDGTDADLDKRISEAMRREMRRKGSDETTELAKFLETDARRGWDGFWSNAENLRCVRGKDFLYGELDTRKHFGHANWQRAREANK